MGTLNNVEINKTRADSFPVIEDVVIVSATSLTINCAGANGVSYEFLSSSDTGNIEPGEQREFFTNSDPTSDTIRFTFSAASDIEVSYSTGTGGGGGGTGTLAFKEPAGIILDLTAMIVVGNPIVFPGSINLESLFIEVQGHVGVIYDYPDHTVRNTTELALMLNRFQDLCIFQYYSETELIILSGTENAESINDLSITYFGGASSMPGGLPTTPSAYNSWGDYLNETATKILQRVNNLGNSMRSTQDLLLPIIIAQSYFGCISIEFVMLEGTVDVAMETPTGPSIIQYPILGVLNDVYGNKFNFNNPNEQILTFLNFSATAKVLVFTIRTS